MARHGLFILLIFVLSVFLHGVLAAAVWPKIVILHTRDEDGCDKYSFSFKERIVYDCITYIARRFHSDSRGGTPAEAPFIFVLCIMWFTNLRLHLNWE